MIKVDGTQIEDRGYNDLGQLTSVDRPTIDETRTYDNRGQVTTIGNGAVGNATYAYDANGNKLSESWSGAMSAWNFTTQSGGNDGYDPEDRFLNFNQPNQSKTLSMTRSDIGNITNVTLNGTGTARGYSNVHELTSVGGSSQTFDTDGNQSTSINGNSYQWDEGGMLKQVTASGNTIEYGYNADGKRIWKKVTDGGNVTETVYVHAGPNRIAEYANGAAPASNGNEYVYAGGIDSLCVLIRAGLQYAIARNQQWSVAALVDSGGNVAERYTYNEFGKRTILAGNGTTVRTSSNYSMDFGYTSRCHESESGLMYFRARFYDPTTGEFISIDPLEYVDGMSQYRAYFVQRQDQDDEKADPNDPFAGPSKPRPTRPDGRPRPALGPGSATEPNGNFKCELDKPIDAPGTINVFTKKKCVRPCTFLHEKQHEKDDLPCCKKARVLYHAAKNGLQRRNIQGKYNAWNRANTFHSECRAYEASLQCAFDSIIKHNCGCSTTNCCQDLYDYINGAKLWKKRFCDAAKRRGAEVPCPF